MRRILATRSTQSSVLLSFTKSRFPSCISGQAALSIMACPQLVPSSFLFPSSSFCISTTPANNYCIGRNFSTTSKRLQDDNKEGKGEVLSEMQQRCHDEIHADRMVVFLTGTPQEPRCRFTVMLLEMFHQLGIHPESYHAVDILEDDEFCEALKEYSGWPTYPQLYIDGTLIGGFDVVKELVLKGDFTKMLKEKGFLDAPEEKK